MSKGGRGKCLTIVGVLIVLQIALFTALALTVGKIKGPKVRFQSANIENMSSGTSSSSSFSMDLVTNFAVKNDNFGQYKYQNSTVSILYGGQVIGTADVPSQKAKARSTRRTNITISINSDKLTNATNLASDMNAGLIILTSECTLKGKVELIKIIKKNKSGKMSCTMTVSLANKTVQDLKCK